MPRLPITFAILAPMVLIQATVASGSTNEREIEFDFAAGILAIQQEDQAIETPASDELSTSINAEQPTTSSAAEDLAKKTQNPVADLISLPFQNNFTFPTGPGDDVLWVLNVQPVIPVKLTKEWNLITRTIVPIIHQPGLTQGASSDNGVGDVQFTSFLSPSDSGDFTWGAGPVFRFPTATKDTLGSEKWSAGPSFVGLTSTGPWVVGGLVQNIWSYTGSSSRDRVNQLLLQPFVNYNLPDGWYLTTSPVVTADWNRPSEQRWTVPVGGGVGKILRIGKLPVNLQLQAYYNVEKPEQVGDWTIRFQIQLLFPAG